MFLFLDTRVGEPQKWKRLIKILRTNPKFIIVCFQSEIGFGKMETYIKLEKLGEVSKCFKGVSHVFFLV